MSDVPQKVSFLERQRTLWRDNHIGLIISLMAAIMLVGASVLAYRQNRFQPPRFPSADSIQVSGRDRQIESVVGLIPETEALTITVSGAANASGSMFLAIYVEEATFNNLDKAVAKHRQPIVDGSSTFTYRASDFPNRIAITAFHDENSDNTLNRNAIGIPTERYGFSNDARGTIGPPTYQEAVIERPESGSIHIYIR